MDDSKQFCENCKRDISVKNFELHITHCSRNIKFCELCNEPISTNRFKDHLDEDHVMEPCPDCEIPLEKWMLSQHKESCQRRLVSCEFCEAEFYFNKYSEHKDFCGSRTEKCVCCQKYIMLKDKEAHSLIHLSSKDIDKNDENISQEAEQNSDNEYNPSIHPSVTNEFYQTISQDMQKKAMQYSENMEISPEKSEDFMKHYGVCYICEQYVRWVDMNVHIPTCATEAGKCSMCGEDVPDGGIKDHMQKYCSKLSETASPKSYNSDAKKSVRSKNRYCYSSDEESGEIPESRHPIRSAASLHTKTEHSDVHENHETESRHSIGSTASLNTKPEPYCLCPLCHISVPRSEIKIHINSCNADSEKCVLCNEDVPIDEMKRHFCHQDQRNYDSVSARSDYDISIERAVQVSIKLCPYCDQQCSSDHILDHVRNCPQSFIECSFCGEKLMKKDKGKHEGFFCKALLENYPPSNSSVPTYAESVKNTTEFRDSGPTSWDEDLICPTCHTRVLISGLEEHSVMCESRVKPCKFCLHDVQVEFETYHLNVCPMIQNQSSHSSRNPKQTGFEKKSFVPKNKKRGNKLKFCQFCKILYLPDILRYHVEECPNRRIACQCGSKLKLKYFEDHIKSHCSMNNANKERKKENKKIPKDKKTSTMQRFTDGIKNILGFPDPEYCGYGEGMQDFYSVSSPTLYSETQEPAFRVYPSSLKYPEPELIPCEFCSKKIPFDDIVEHTTGCDPELVSRLKKNPGLSSYEKKSGNYAHQRSFFEDGKAFSTAIVKHAKKRNEEHGAKPGEYLSHSTKDEEYEKKYLGSDVKSFWGHTVDSEEESFEHSSGESKPQHSENQKEKMSEPVPKQLTSDSEEEMRPYNASINKKNLMHPDALRNTSTKIYKETENRSESSHEYRYTSNLRTRGNAMELYSDCLDQEINQGSNNMKSEELTFENSQASKDLNRLDDDDDRRGIIYVKSSSDKKNTRKVNQDSEEDMEWSDHSRQESKRDAVQEKLYQETVPVKRPNTKIKDHQDQADVVHERKSLKDRVNEKDNEMQRHKYKSKAEKGEQDKKAEFSVYKARYSNLSEDDFVVIKESSNKFGIIGQDRNIQDKMHIETSLIQRGKESSLQMESDKLRSSTVSENRDPEILLNKKDIKTEIDKNKSSLSNSEEYYQKLQNFSFRTFENKELENSKDSSTGDKLRSSTISENRDPEILLNKQDIETEIDKNKSSHSNSEEYFQKLQNFSFRTFENKELENSKDSSTGVSAKDFVSIYSKMNNLSAEYITVQLGMKDKNKGYVSSLTLGSERYLSYPELKPTKDLAEELAATKAMAAIKEQIEVMSGSTKEFESKDPDILQRKQHIEPHEDKLEPFQGFSSQDYQQNQSPKNYPESKELKKDKDIEDSRESSCKGRFQDMPKSRSARESREPDLLQQNPNMVAEMDRNRPLHLSSDDSQVEQHRTSKTGDNRLDSKYRMVDSEFLTQGRNQGIDNSAFKMEFGMSKSSKMHESKEKDFLSKKHAFKIEMHINKPFSTSSAEDYKNNQHPFSTTPEDKGFHNSRSKVAVSDNEDEDKLFFNPEHAMSRSVSVLQKERLDILQQMRVMEKEIAAKPQSNVLKESYQKRQYPFSRTPEMKRFEDTQGKVDSREYSTESRNQDKPKSTKSIENRDLDIDAQTILQQKKGLRAETDMIKSPKISSVDEHKKHLSSFALESKEFQDRRNKEDPRGPSFQARYQNIEEALKVLPAKSRSNKASDYKEPDMDPMTILHQKQTMKSEVDMNRSLYKNSADNYQKHVPADEYGINSVEYLTEARNRDILRSYIVSENKELDMDLQTSLLLKQRTLSDIDANVPSKNSAVDYQMHRSSKVLETDVLEDKKNKIDSREFLTQGRNQGYENPAFVVEPVTKLSKQNMAKDKTCDEIIDGIKVGLENAKLTLGRSGDRNRDMNAILSEHDKRVEAWKKWRDSKPQDSEEDL